MNILRCIQNRARIVVVLCSIISITAGVIGVAAASPGLYRTLPLLRTDGSIVGMSPGAQLPKGTVKLAIIGQAQSFIVDVSNLAGDSKGLAVFIGTAPQMTNGILQYVDLLSQISTNNHWHLDLESSSGAPAQLGVANLTNLIGMTVFVASDTNHPILRALVTDLVPNPSQLSFRRKVPMILPNMPLSQKAKGTISISYNGRTGGSVIEISARNLNKNNRYVENDAGSNCMVKGVMSLNGKARWGSDTGRGDELFMVDPQNGLYATDVGATTAWDDIGRPIVIVDCFDGVHLLGEIPGPK